MTTTNTCGSCGMPIETGRYCTHCIDENGQLQSFDQRFERMTAWGITHASFRERANGVGRL